MDRRTLILGAVGMAGLGAARAWPALADEPAQPFALSGQLIQGGWARGMVPPGTAHLALNGNPVRIAADGRFLIAFDRDAGPVARLVAETAKGMVSDYAIPIARRNWQIEHIPIGPRPGSPPSEEFARRRAAELAQINAARAVEGPSEGWRQRMIWPATGRLSGRFGSQRIYNGTPGSYHSGTDIATGTSGTPFVAPADGVVILAAAAPFTLEGLLLMIDHGMGLNSAFLHCSAHAVELGQVVRQGQVIGQIGATGRATGPHLHWSIKWHESRLDAELFVPAMPVPPKP